VEGDGSLGWPGEGPYAGIVVGAAAPGVPSPLEGQLADGGRLIIPVGTRAMQDLTVVERSGERLARHTLEPCVFVPLLGRWGFTA
ncbi:MAG: protein-L-isoaspartate O-methyltransferase family protein, partial [Candidatus Limnocylindrales bacterium]